MRFTGLRPGAAVAMKGAPEAVLSRCSGAMAADGTTVALDAEGAASTALALAAEGYRVLGLAFAEPALMPSGDVESALSFVGLVGLDDPVRAEAAGAVGEVRRAGDGHERAILACPGDHSRELLNRSE